MSACYVLTPSVKFKQIIPYWEACDLRALEQGLEQDPLIENSDQALCRKDRFLSKFIFFTCQQFIRVENDLSLLSGCGPGEGF